MNDAEKPNYERQLARRFLALPYRHQHAIATSLNVLTDAEWKLADDEAFSLALFKRAHKKGLLGKLWAETEKLHDDPAGFNPFESLTEEAVRLDDAEKAEQPEFVKLDPERYAAWLKSERGDFELVPRDEWERLNALDIEIRSVRSILRTAAHNADEKGEQGNEYWRGASYGFERARVMLGNLIHGERKVGER